MLFLYCKKKQKKNKENIIDVITICMPYMVYDIHQDKNKDTEYDNQEAFYFQQLCDSKT